MGKFSDFQMMTGTAAERLMHSAIRGKIETIRANCGFSSAAAFDAFWAKLNAHLRGEWPDYEDNRRMTLFERAARGERVSRTELIGPHLEIAGKLA